MAQLIDMVEGMFSRIKLDDGSVIFLSVERNTMRIVKLGFLGFPAGTIGKISGVKQKLITDSLLRCKNIEEAKKMVSSNIKL